jgi:hypothetical protein
MIRTPEDVAKRVQTLHETLGLSGFVMERNIGGRIVSECVLESIWLFGQEMAPRLRASADKEHILLCYQPERQI